MRAGTGPWLWLTVWTAACVAGRVMSRAAAWSSIVVLVVGCAPSPPTVPREDGGPPADTALSCGATYEEIRAVCGSPATAAECSPDGAGWCCPFTIPPPSTDCACVGGTGGFVLSPCDCAARMICDLPVGAWGMRVDEHGCPALEIRMPTSCACLCPPKTDAGIEDGGVGLVDAGEPDAGTDAP